MQHLLKDSDLSKAQIEALIALGKAVKADPKKYGQALAGKSVVTLFEKPSCAPGSPSTSASPGSAVTASTWISRTARSASGSR